MRIHWFLILCNFFLQVMHCRCYSRSGSSALLRRSAHELKNFPWKVQRSLFSLQSTDESVAVETVDQNIRASTAQANVLNDSDNKAPLLVGDRVLPSKWVGFALLNSVAVLWGTQHVVIKTALESYPSTSLMNFWRFFLSALLFSPSLVQLLSQKDEDGAKAQTVRDGAELGLYTFLGFAFQAIGLETTTASRSAFLLYLNVKIVPFLAAVLYGRQIPVETWLSALLALSGTCLLSTDGGMLNTGDIWCIAAAVASALFILRLETFSQRCDAAELNSMSFASVAGLCAIWVLGDNISGSVTVSSSDTLSMITSPLFQHPLPVIYLGVITTGLCNFLQTIGQRSVAAEKAAIIYSMDPVYGAFFSWLVLHEQFTAQGYAGAALIMLGIFISTKSSNDSE